MRLGVQRAVRRLKKACAEVSPVTLHLDHRHTVTLVRDHHVDLMV